MTHRYQARTRGALTHPVTNILLTQPDSLVPLCPPSNLPSPPTSPHPLRCAAGLSNSGAKYTCSQQEAGQVGGGQARLRLFPAALTHRGNPLSASSLPPFAPPRSRRVRKGAPLAALPSLSFLTRPPSPICCAKTRFFFSPRVFRQPREHASTLANCWEDQLLTLQQTVFFLM